MVTTKSAGVFSNCPRCGRLLWSDDKGVHNCPPAWEVVCDEHDSEHVVTVYACDAQDAAELWAKRYDEDSAEYSIASGSGHESRVVRVRRVEPVPRKGGTNWEYFTVAGEFEPTYWAEAVK